MFFAIVACCVSLTLSPLYYCKPLPNFPSPKSQCSASAASSSCSVCFDQQVCLHAFQHPNQTAGRVFDIPSCPQPRAHLEEIFLLQEDEVALDGRSDYSVDRLPKSEAARTAQSQKSYAWMGHGRARGLVARARWCRDLLDSSCSYSVLTSTVCLRYTYQSRL